MNMGEVILTMKGIDKSFPGVHALDHVDLEIRKGEVLALMGENGAGKSTLMKVLTGIYKKDEGTITYEGKEIEFENPSAAQEAGVIIVHQELNMLSHLTVAQNIFIGREIMKGNKARRFYLEVSFLPIMLLGILSCCIGLLFLTPYMNTTYTNFYLELMSFRNRQNKEQPFQE